METLYGYERRIEGSVDEQDEEGKNFLLTIFDLLNSFEGIMRKSYELESYAYNMAFDECEFGWFLYYTGDEVIAE